MKTPFAEFSANGFLRHERAHSIASADEDVEGDLKEVGESKEIGERRFTLSMFPQADDPFAYADRLRQFHLPDPALSAQFEEAFAKRKFMLHNNIFSQM